MNYVPYSGGGEATTALLGGKVQAGVAGLNEFAEQIKNGNLKGLLISSAEQVEGASFAQTATQIDPKLEFQNWRSIMAPTGISPDLTTQYVEAMTRMHDGSGWTDAVKKNGWNDNFLAGDEFGTWLKEENARVQTVLADSVWPRRRVNDRRVRADVASTRRPIPWGDWGCRRAARHRRRRPARRTPPAGSTSASGVGAGFMPKVVGVLLIVLSAALIVQVARGRLGEPDEAEGDVDVRHTRWVPLAVCVAAVLIFIAAVEPLGYIIVSSIVFWLTAWAIGARHIVRTAIIAVALSLSSTCRSPGCSTSPYRQGVWDSDVGYRGAPARAIRCDHPANLLFALVGPWSAPSSGAYGIGPALTIALLLPMTYGMEPAPAFIMFAGIYYGAMYGGSTTSILLKTPANPAQ